jgi:hypothetical protein
LLVSTTQQKVLQEKENKMFQIRFKNEQQPYVHNENTNEKNF